jgi:hypothetical protein
MALAALDRDSSYTRDRAYVLQSPFTPYGRLTLDASDYLGWGKEIIQQGKSYLRLQAAFPYISDGIDMINGMKPALNVASLSDLQMELTIRNLKELVAAQTNLRIIPAFKTEIQEFQHQNEILNKCFMAWQQMTFADRRIRKCWQYAAGAGTGYAYVKYDANYYYKGKGDQVIDALGPLDVIPVGLPRTHEIQKAYCVALRIETPYHEAVRLYPRYADRLRPSRDSSRGRGTVMSEAVKFASSVLRRFGPGSTQENEPATWENVDIYYLYIDDQSVNNTGQVIPMGRSGTSWYYEVPYIGQRIPDPSEPGRFRDAVDEDCLLYPTRRLIKYTDDDCLTPDPMDQVNPYWHSKVPVVQFRADDWPWNFLGFPLTRAGQSFEKANNEMARGVVDANNARLNPTMTFDRNTMSLALAQSINTRIPGQRFGVDQTFAGDQMKPLPGMLEMYTVPGEVLEFIKQNEARLTHQMGVADAQALARARQLPSSDSMDKILEALGPLPKDQSRNMEESIRGFGELWKSNFFQFMSAKRRMELVGPDGLADADFDFDPGTLIPTGTFDWADEEGRHRGDILSVYKDNGRSDLALSTVPMFQRARWHKDQFTFTVTPYSIHEINSMTRKLFHLQLMRSGFPLDWWTLAELFDVRNFGPYPKMKDPETDQMRECRNIIERWIAQMEIQARVAQATGGGQQGKGKGGGHPPTGQAAPTLNQKNRGGAAGTSSIIRESKK